MVLLHDLLHPGRTTAGSFPVVPHHALQALEIAAQQPIAANVILLTAVLTRLYISLAKSAGGMDRLAANARIHLDVLLVGFGLGEDRKLPLPSVPLFRYT